MIPEKTWSLISPKPIRVKNSNPSLYWWFGVGLTEPILLALIGKFCFNISPAPETKRIATVAQHKAEQENKFGVQTLDKEIDDTINLFDQISWHIGKNFTPRTYQIQEVLSWLNKENIKHDC